MATLTFDMGQTGFRARVTAQGKVIGLTTGMGRRNGSSLDDLLTMVAERVAQSCGIDSFEVVAGGVTGVFGRVPDLTLPMQHLRRRFGTKRLVVADDAVTAYLGALGERMGVVAAIGTGLVALGHGESEQWARVDGVGAMSGDDGAGWWIGRQGLIAAFSAMDGREGGSSRLLAAAQNRYGAVTEIPFVFRGLPSPIATVAEFAFDVATAARDGDAVARSIWREASKFVGRAIAAAAHRTNLAAPVAYALVGGVAQSADLLEPHIAEYLSHHLGATQRINALGGPLEGADALLTLRDTGAINGLVRDTDMTENLL